ncbi:MAG: acyl-CoA reductase [Cryomorphaceae bacterium]|nr:acyl-CoA reductase [Cryomorphaceae bacterium]
MPDITPLDARFLVLERLGLGLADLAQNSDLLARASVRNPWFTPEFSVDALTAWSQALRAESLDQWKPPWPKDLGPSRRVGIVGAGNLPLVALHDVLCAYLAGHEIWFKASSDDPVLTSAVLDGLRSLDPDARIFLAERLNGVDALIATGGDQAVAHFDQYFSHIPRILRGARTSAAVVPADATDAELEALADDIFRYFGRGCRSVTHLAVERGLDVQRLFASWMRWAHLASHARYGSNYDYHRALFMLNREPFLENNWVVLREHGTLKPPLSVLHYSQHDSAAQAESWLDAQADQLQTVVGRGRTPFGQSQFPALWDYADGVDTPAFLVGLGQ